MSIEIKETITSTLSKLDLIEIITNFYKKEGYNVTNVRFNLDQDYSDPDCDRFGPDTIFKDVTATLTRR